jgi:hypothetical protein
MAKKLTEDQFYAKYNPEINQVLLKSKAEGINPEDITAYGGCMYETYGEEYERVKQIALENPKRVWTILDPGGRHLVIAAGYHYVNRFGYLITEEEWSDPMEEYWD